MNLSFYEQTLAAGESLTIAASGVFIGGMAGEAPYEIRLDSGPLVDFETGYGFQSPQQFDRVEILNSHTDAQTIKIAISDGVLIDNRLVGKIDISGGIRLAGNRTAAYGTVAVATSATLVRAANSDRGTCLLQNVGGSDVYVGTDGSVTTSNGVLVAAGASITLTVQTAIHAIADGSASELRFIDEAL